MLWLLRLWSEGLVSLGPSNEWDVVRHYHLRFTGARIVSNTSFRLLDHNEAEMPWSGFRVTSPLAGKRTRGTISLPEVSN